MHTDKFGFYVNYNDLTNMMDYERFEINVTNADFRKVMINDKDFENIKNVRKSFSRFLNGTNRNIGLENIINTLTPIVFGCINKKWTFRFSPVMYLNNFLIILGDDANYSFVELENDKERGDYKDYFLKRVNYLTSNLDSMPYELRDFYNKNGIDDKSLLSLAKNTVNKLDYILDLEKEDLGEYFEGKVETKDLMQILTIRSLDNLAKTQNSLYSIMPYLYYETVSKDGNVAFPHSLIVDGSYYDYNYSTINNRIEAYLNRNDPLFKTGIDRYKGIYHLNFEIARSGESDVVREEILKSYVHHGADPRLVEQYKKKLEFFKNYDRKMELVGLDTLSGYYGYVLRNDFVVFDKVAAKNPERCKHPIYGNAIYRMPADMLGVVGATKGEIMDFIHDNPKSHVKRISHDKDNRYMKKLEELQLYPNVSSKTAEEVMDEYKVKKLVK